jgi:predicted phage terminase large subunit-like protein
METVRGNMRRVNINYPPRSLKSVAISVCFPAWLLGKNPTEKIICVSSNYSLAVKLHNDSRTIMNSSWYKVCFPNVNLKNFSSNSNQHIVKDTEHIISTTSGGFRQAFSAGAMITGSGADKIIIDDLMDASDALSRTKMQNVNRWAETVLFSRLNDKKKGVIINMGQRLDENDFSASCIKKGWESFVVPVYFDKDTTYKIGKFQKKVKAGEWLQSDRFSQEDANELAKRVYYTQYLQQPIPDDGEIYKISWFNRYNKLPESRQECYVSVDTAYKTGEANDYTAITVWVLYENNWYIANIIRDKLEYPELKRKIKNVVESYQPNAILIEDKASGQSLIQDLSKEIKTPVISIKIAGGFDKVSRARTSTDMIEGGKVFIPTQASWLDDFELELKAFPNGTHDDQVDSMTQFLNWIKNKNIAKPRIRIL